MRWRSLLGVVLYAGVVLVALGVAHDSFLQILSGAFLLGAYTGIMDAK